VKTGLFSPINALRRLLGVAGILGFLAAVPLLGAPDSPGERAEAAFQSAESAWATNRVSPELSWSVGRAAFDWAEFQTKDADRARIAEAGILACRSALSNSPASAPANYYLALCLGQLARTKKLAALKLVSQMEGLLANARTLDESLDHAGPDRSLGLLYLDAPVWPTSIGSKSKARRHLERAVTLDPDHPENRLSLAEALLRWREKDAARSQLDAIDALWEAARKRLAGPDWEGAWSDWETRRTALAKTLGKGKATKAGAAPTP
jgi:tetratricopeptide (TPR) repeat protein